MIDWSAGAPGRRILASIRAEFLRYKQLGEGAFDQVTDAELTREGPAGGSSIATITWHIGGNLRSRFTDFLTADGEKPWRNREAEFDRRMATRAELLNHWEQGWQTLMDAVNELTDQRLEQWVTIRGQRLFVHEALHRALAHVAYHVGQIVYLAKEYRGPDWKSLSIPRGESDKVNKKGTLERPKVH